MQFVRSPQSVTERSQCEQQRFLQSQGDLTVVFVLSIAKPSQQRLQINANKQNLNL